MDVAHVEQTHRVELGRPGVARAAVFGVELQQATPVGVPTFRKRNDIGEATLLSVDVVAVSRQEMAGRVARVLRVRALQIVAS